MVVVALIEAEWHHQTEEAQGAHKAQRVGVGAALALVVTAPAVKTERATFHPCYDVFGHQLEVDHSEHVESEPRT